MRLAAATNIGSRQIGLTLLPASPSIFVDRDGVPLVMNAETVLCSTRLRPPVPEHACRFWQPGSAKCSRSGPPALPARWRMRPRDVTPVHAYLEREPLEVTRATLAPGYIGMYLVEVKLPSFVNRGTAELYIEAQNQQSNRIRIFLEP